MNDSGAPSWRKIADLWNGRGDYHADCYAIYLEWSVKRYVCVCVCVANLKGGGTFMPAG